MIYKIVHNIIFCKISYVLLGILAASIAGTLSYLIWLFLEKETAKFHIRISMHFLRMVVACYLMPIFPFVIFSFLDTSAGGYDFVPLSVAMVVMLVVLVPICGITLVGILLAKYWNYRKKHYTCLDNVPIKDKERLALLEKWRKRLKIRQKVYLSTNSRMDSPGILYYKGYQIIMPDYITEDKDFNMALLHELVHLKHRDLITKEIVAVINILHGFNPAIKRLREKIESWSEVDCDFAVCKYGAGEFTRQEYYDCLLRLKVQSQSNSYIEDMCGLVENQNIVSFRVDAVHKVTAQEMRMPVSGYLLTAAIPVMAILGSMELFHKVNQKWILEMADYNQEALDVYSAEADSDRLFGDRRIIYCEERILDREESFDFVIRPNEVWLFDISDGDANRIWLYTQCKGGEYFFGCVDDKGQLLVVDSNKSCADWLAAESGSLRKIFVEYRGGTPMKIEIMALTQE